MFIVYSVRETRIAKEELASATSALSLIDQKYQREIQELKWVLEALNNIVCHMLVLLTDPSLYLFSFRLFDK